MENKNLYRLAELGLQCITDSHELSSNLYKIDVIAKKNNLPDITKYIENIRNSMNAISKIKYQKTKADIITKVSVLDLANSVKKYFSYYHDVEIDCKKDVILNTSRLAMIQSLINLVDNALFFSEENKDKKKTCLITIDENSITISDNGTGVPEEIKEQIFDLYFTTKDISRQGCDTGGIGLYAVKEHIDNIGYRITVDNNTILKGANFKIIFN